MGYQMGSKVTVNAQDGPAWMFDLGICWNKSNLSPRFESDLNPISAVMQIYSEIGPGNGLHPASGDQH
jgi:hypothetical protein